MESSAQEFGIGHRHRFTDGFKKKHYSDMLFKKRMQVINSEGCIENRLKKEKEIYNNFENYLKLISSLAEGEPELANDRYLSINASHVEAVSQILQTHGSQSFTHQVVQLGVHKALAVYVQAYLQNRNNPDLEAACCSALNIFEVITRGKPV